MSSGCPASGAATGAGCSEPKAAMPLTSGGAILSSPGLEGGFSQDDRWRDLFPIPSAPLPPLRPGASECSRRHRAKVQHRVEESNSIIQCLNEMYLPAKGSHDHSYRMGVHDTAHHFVYKQLSRMKQPSGQCTEREAIQELLQNSVSYSGDEGSTTVRSYQRDLVSLPDCGAAPVPMHQVIDNVGRDMLRDPSASMLLSDSEFGQMMEDGGVIRPYMDVILQKDVHVYQTFIKDLYNKGMIDFTDSPADLVTPFFVRKKNNKLRFILDCRQVNRRFRPPPPLALAAGSSWSQLVLPPGQNLYVAQSDIKDYFYSLALPSSLQSLFCLPPVDASLLEAWDVDAALRPYSLVGNQAWPRLRVVPMGWSWAMFLSQRIHQHLCLEATGLDESRLLVEGNPPPCLEGGEVVLLPYADNLNVAGVNPARVQEIKDVIVQKLRKTGFRVHEELDATSAAQSLGFYIDGVGGVVQPIPARLQMVIKAFSWLSRRPRVKGRAVEKLIGHAVHFCMLRRDLLSIFRSLYDFIQHSYEHRCRLWASAAKEARWASHLLKLCSVNLRRTWSNDVTSSDASLSGVAVSRRPMDFSTQSSVGGYKESWRYKINTVVKPRKAALESLDPFSNPDTVKPMVVEKRDPFMLDDTFPEVPDTCMQPELWHDVVSIHMTRPEHITLLEGRGVVAAVRHKLRSQHEFGKKHLHFNDNMGVVLLCSKGRSSSFGMLRVCRRLAALCLVSDIFWHVRWVPSEKNVSDRASRRWESERIANAASGVSKTQQKAFINRWCYGQASSRNAGGGTWAQKSASFPEEQTDHSKGSKGEDSVPATTTGGAKRHVTLQRSDKAGTSGCVRTGCNRLQQEDGDLEKVCQKQEAEFEKQDEIRRGLLLVSEQFVRARFRHPRRVKNPCSHSRQPPRVFSQEPIAQNQASSTRLEQVRASTNKASFAMGASECLDNSDVGDERDDSSGGSVADVHCLPSTRRMFGSACGGPSDACARNGPFRPSSASSRKKRTVEGGFVGRESSSRFSHDALARKSDSTATQNKHAHVRHQLRSHGKSLEEVSQNSRIATLSCSTVPVETCRSVSRPTMSISKPFRGQTEGQMASRCLGQEIRGPCSNQPGILCSGQNDPAQVSSGATSSGNKGPKTFWPPVRTFPKRRYVIEVFSGCGRLSRAMSALGFVARAYDIEYNHECDLLNQDNLNKLLQWIRSHAGSIALIWLGTPCTSWSRARKHDGGPPPLRDDDDNLVSGFPHLNTRDKAKVAEGNQLLQVSVDIIALATELSIRWVMENPFSSRLWLVPSVKLLVTRGASFHQVDYCAYGMPWRKSIGLLSENFHALPRALHICHPKYGRCEFSHHRHLQLTGKDASNKWLTLRAQPYPTKLCAALAAQLVSEEQGTRGVG